LLKKSWKKDKLTNRQIIKLSKDSKIETKKRRVLKKGRLS